MEYETLSFEVPFLYQISLFSNQNEVICEISLFQSSHFSIITDLSPKILNYLKSLPKSLLSKLIQISPDFSKMIINQGLQGGGICICSRKKTAPLELKQIFNEIIERKIKDQVSLNNEKSLEFSKRFSDSLKNLTISERDLIELSKIPAKDVHYCFEVLFRLTENFGVIQFSDKYNRDRRALAVDIARKLLFYGNLYFSVDSTCIGNYYKQMDSLTKILIQLEKNLKSYKLETFDSFTLISIKGLISVSRRPRIISEFWENFLYKNKNFAYLMYLHEIESQEEYIVDNHETFSTLFNLSSTSSIYYFIYIDLLDAYIQGSHDDKAFISSVLQNDLERLNSLNPKSSFEIQSIFFNFASKCILNDRVTKDFVNQLLSSLEIMKNCVEEGILEIVVNSLRILRGVEDSEVRKRVNEINEDIKNLPLKSEIKELASLPFSSLFKEVKSKFLIEQKTFFGKFLRCLDLEKLTKGFDSNNSIVLAGLTGMGKTRLAIEYANRFEHKYDYITYFNCENKATFEVYVRLFAKILCDYNGKYDSTKEHLINRLRKERKVLNIFAGCKNREIFQDFLLPEFHNIIIFNQEHPKDVSILKISKLQEEQSLHLIQELIKVPISPEGLKKLLNIIDGWPLAANIMIAYLKNDEKLTDQGIEELNFDKLDLVSILEMISKLMRKLKKSSEILLGLISFCNPARIPRKMLEKAFEESLDSNNDWWVAVSELEKFYIVESSRDHFDIQNTIYLALTEYRKPEYSKNLLKYIDEKFQISLGLSEDPEFKEMIPQIFSILDKHEGLDMVKVKVALMISLALIKITEHQEYIKILCNEVKGILENTEENKESLNFYFFLGFLYYKVKDFKNACECLIVSNRIPDDEMTDEHKILRDLKLAKIYLKINKNNEALKFLERMLKLLKKDKQKNKVKYFKYLEISADLFKDLKKNYKKACDDYQEILNENENCDQVEVNFKLAQCFQLQGIFNSAISTLDDISDSRILTSANRRYLEINLMYAELYENTKNYRLAVYYLETALKFDSTLKSKGLLLRISHIAEKGGMVNDAIFYMRQHIESNNLQKDTELLRELVNLYEKNQDHQSSIKTLENLIEIKEESLGLYNHEMSSLNRELSAKFNILNKKQQELIYLEKSLKINKELQNELGKADDLEKIGIIHFDDYKNSLNESSISKALESFQECLIIKENIQGTDEIEIFRVINYIASIYTHRRLFDKVVNCLKRFEVDDSRFLDFEDPVVGDIFYGLGFAYRKLNRNHRSKQNFLRFVNWRRKFHGSEDRIAFEVEKNIDELN